MYNPKHFQVENWDEISRLVAEYPLATLITSGGGPLTISHLPLVMERRGEKIKLTGHLAKGNPHWRAMEQSPIQVIFQGAHGYITPTWYADHDVPTWNYSVVHMQGSVKLLESYEETVQALKSLSEQMEKGLPKPWEFGIPDDLADPKILTSAIIGFEIEVHQVSAKFKLSQNRKPADYAGVLQGLESTGKEQHQALRDLMLRHRRE
jgi:transcriptional regulator